MSAFRSSSTTTMTPAPSSLEMSPFPTARASSWPRARTFSHDGRYGGTSSGQSYNKDFESLLGMAAGKFNATTTASQQYATPTTSAAVAAAVAATASSSTESAMKNNADKMMPQQFKIVVALSVAMLVSTVAWNYREQLSIFFDKERIQARAVIILTRLDRLPKVRSYLTYAVGFALWETLGLSTIPVETAAGMIFGWDAFWLSSIGKFAGAMMAFCICRYGFLAEWVQYQLSSNSFLNLVKASTSTSPLQVVFMLKCSCFPETIKNYGSAVLSPIRAWMFALASLLHGCAFSWLWTYLGVDASLRIREPDYPPDKRLQVWLLLAGINAFVVSPLAMAAWLRKLRQDCQAKPSSSSQSDCDTVSTVSSTDDQERTELINSDEFGNV